MENVTWHRIDNSAKIYPLSLNRNTQNLYRLAVDLVEPVDPEVLQSALTASIKRYPTLDVSLKKGVFWHYFERLNGKPVICEDSDLLLREIYTVSTCGYNFRVSYYDKRIAVDFFHALCDGMGAAEFLKTLLYEYLTEKGYDIDPEEKLKLPNSPVLKDEFEDGFMRYARKIKLKDAKPGIAALRGVPAFTLDDFSFSYAGSGIIEGTFDTDAIKALAKSYDSTITAFLGALVAYSIYETKRRQASGNKPIVLFIPIDLRRAFPSKTLLNFSLFSRCRIDISDALTFEEIIGQTKAALARDTNRDSLQNNIDITSKTQKMLIFRILPLPVKQFIFRFSKLFFGKGKKTMTFTNLGIIDLPKDMKPHISHASIIASTISTAPMNISVCSVLGRTTVTFTRKIVDTEIEKFFFRFLAEKGVNVTVASNYWEE